MKMSSNLKKKIIISTIGVFSLLTLILPTLTSCSGSIEGVNPPAIINNVFPNLWVFVAQIISMLILFSAVMFLAWKPTNKMLEKRRAFIQNEIDEATKSKELAQAEYEKAKQLTEASTVKSKQMLVESNAKVSKYEKAELARVHEETQKMISDANKIIEKNYEKAQKDLDKQIIEMAMKTTEVLLDKKITITQDKKMIEDFIKDLKK